MLHEEPFTNCFVITRSNQEFKQKVPGIVTPDFTHDSFHGTETLYMAAAILVSVPTWSDRSPLHDIDEECANGQSVPTSKRAAKRKKTKTTKKMKKREKISE